MQTKNQIAQTRKIAIVILILGLLFSTFSSSSLPNVKAQGIASRVYKSITPIRNHIDPPLYIVNFSTPSASILPKDARDAIAQAMNSWPDPAPDNHTFYLIDINWHDWWAIATLTSANLESPLKDGEETQLGLGNLIALILVRIENRWHASIDVDQRNVQKLLALIPDSELSPTAKSALFPPSLLVRQSLDVTAQQAYNNYKFPWPANQAWRLTTGWHDSTTWGGLFPANTSLDFDIVGGEGANSDIKAAASGTLTYKCTTNVDDQALVYITTDGTTEKLGYLHLSKSSLRFASGDHVSQGDVIGRMASLDNGSGGGTTPPLGSCAARVNMRTHLHIYFPSKPFTMDGVTFSDASLPWNQDLFSGQGSGGSLYASTPTDLWRIDPSSGNSAQTAHACSALTDIAFDGNTLYGVSFSDLLLINPATGACSIRGNIGYSGVNALTVAPNGTMYAGTGSGEFLRINKSNGTGTFFGYYLPGYRSSGDLAILGNTMYASTIRDGYPNNWLIKIDLNTKVVTSVGSIGQTGVCGIDFKDGTLYGVTCETGYLLIINTTTGSGTRINTFSADFGGLSTSPSSAPSPLAEFDAWPQSGNAPLPVSMHIVDTSNITSCFWDYGDNQTGTACTPFHNHTYSNAGSYTVTLTVNGPGGSDSMTRNSYIIVNNPGSTSWQGEYYNNETLSGNPVLVRDDPKINFDWFEGSPDPLVNPDHFSARWTKNVYFGGAGRYRFDVFRDDGVRLWVDDILILDAWSEGREWVSAEYSLPAGNHTVRLEIFEFEGWAAAILNISTPYIASGGANDGWVLESTETSNQGGIINAAATTFVLGDNAQDRQYRAILHFNTSALPDNAIIDSVRLRIKPNSMVGTDPFSTHQKLVFDIRKPYFGSAAALAIEDFQAGASRNSIGSFGTTPLNGWYYANLNATAFPYINLRGITQFRLRFQRDDNDDLSADYIGFYSGNAGSNRPLLIIQYHMDGQLFAQELVTPVP